MKRIIPFLLCFAFATASTAQIFSENIGTPVGTTSIASYTCWQNNGLLTFSNAGAMYTYAGMMLNKKLIEEKFNYKIPRWLIHANMILLKEGSAFCFRKGHWTET